MTYCVFAGPRYYPGEGLDKHGDFQGLFDTKRDAVKAVNEWAKKEENVGYDLCWWQICDHSTMTVIERGDGTCLPSL